MLTNKLTTRLVALAAVAAVFGALAGAAAAGADDPEILDATKTVQGLQKKMDELRLHGRWARDGKLSLGAVCGDEAPSQVFMPWLDPAEYVPAPQGDMEDTSQWTLKGDAAVASGNSPFSPGGSSLFLSDGDEAISPVICVSTAHPTVRMFARNTGSADSRLEVQVYYEDLDGKVKHLKIAKLRGGPSWSPTTTVPLYVNLLAAASEDGMTAIALRFKAKDVKSKTAGWALDDLYVDPFKSR